MPPKISIIMPVFNVETYVAGAIESVLDQSFKDFELLIIDDGSEDSSLEICRLYEDPRIKIIQQKNRGLAGARNTGIRESSGQYLAFLDSDDLWTSDKLQCHFNLLEGRLTVGVSYSASTLIDDHNNPIGVIQNPKISDVGAKDVFLRNPVGNGSAPVIRKKVFNDIGFDGGRGYTEWFDENFRQSEDIECWMRIALSTNWRFAGIAEPLTQYRVNEGGLSSQTTKQLKSWEQMAEKIRVTAPEFHEKWVGISRAFQLRYLARRATRMRDGGSAMRLMVRAFASDFDVIFSEPKKTIETLAAALLLYVLPLHVYERCENFALAKSGGARA